MMTVRYILLIVAGAYLLVSCSKDPDHQASTPCPLTLDSTETLLAKEYQGKKYFLVKRISGWHDKSVIIQLFDQAPKLGKCNEDIISPLYEDSIETNLPFIKLIANLEANEFDVVYGDSNAANAPVELVFDN